MQITTSNQTLQQLDNYIKKANKGIKRTIEDLFSNQEPLLNQQKRNKRSIHDKLFSGGHLLSVILKPFQYPRVIVYSGRDNNHDDKINKLLDDYLILIEKSSLISINNDNENHYNLYASRYSGPAEIEKRILSLLLRTVQDNFKHHIDTIISNNGKLNLITQDYYNNDIKTIESFSYLLLLKCFTSVMSGLIKQDGTENGKQVETFDESFNIAKAKFLEWLTKYTEGVKEMKEELDAFFDESSLLTLFSNSPSQIKNDLAERLRSSKTWNNLLPSGLSSKISNSVNYWEKNLPMVFSKTDDFNAMSDFTRSPGEQEFIYRMISEGELSSLKEEKRFSQSRGSRESRERHKWFYYGEGNPGVKNSIQCRITLLPGVLSLLKKLAKEVREHEVDAKHYTVIKKTDELDCLGIHEDALIFFNNLVLKVEKRKKDESQKVEPRKRKKVEARKKDESQLWEEIYSNLYKDLKELANLLKNTDNLKEKIYNKITSGISTFNSILGDEMLYQAIEDSDLSQAQNLVDEVANFEEIHFGNTLLHLAVIFGSSEMVRGLIDIDNGAEVNIQNKSGMTPLHFAILLDKEDTVKAILKRADINIRDREGSTPLHMVVRNGNQDLVEILIEMGAMIDIKDELGKKPVEYAKEGNKSIREILRSVAGLFERIKDNEDNNAIKEYIKEGIIINAKDKDDKTPLHYAVQNNNLEIVCSLLTNHAVYNALDKNRKELAYYSQQGTAVWNILKFTDNLFYLINNSNDGTYFDSLFAEVMNLFEDRYEEVVKSIVNAKNREGKTPLHIAASRQDNLKLVELLINNGADVSSIGRTNPKLKFNVTPLHIAAKDGNNEIVKLFLGLKEIDVNVQSNSGETPLHLAALGGYQDVIKCLLDKGADLTTKDKEGRTPLHYAAQSNGKKAVELLIGKVKDKKAYVAIQDKKGKTPLHYAAESNSEKVLELLIQQAEDKDEYVAAKDKEDRTPLHYAAQGNNEKVLELLIQQAEDKDEYVAAKDKEDRTPLHYAAQSNGREAVELLIEKVKDKKAYIAIQDKKGKTPLHYAAQDGYLEIVNVLLNRESDVNARDLNHLTPLHYAARNNHLKILKALLEKGGKFDAVDVFNKKPINYTTGKSVSVKDVKDVLESTEELFTSIKKQDSSQTIEDLLKRAIINAKDKDGFTPLHYAAEQGNLEAIKKLLDHTTNVELLLSTTDKGDTVLHLAVRKGHNEIVRSLVKYVHDKYPDELENFINTKAEGNTTPLHLAAQNGYEEIVKDLLEKRADIKAQTELGRTALHLAIENCRMKVVQVLVQHISSNQQEIEEFINKQDKNGWTPLYLAIENGQDEAVDLLLKNGANVEGKDNWTPLHSVAQNGYEKIIDILLDYSKRSLSNDEFSKLINYEAKDRKTPLHIAAKNGHSEIVKLLLGSDAKVNARDKVGRTTLHLAAQNGYKDVVEVLLKVRGIDVNAKTIGGATSLHYAAQNGHKDVVEDLLKVDGIEMNAKTTDQGVTPLHLAAQNGHKEVMEVLLMVKDIDVNAKAKYDATPLHLAAQNGYKEVVEALLKVKDIDVNAKAKDDVTPLHIASQEGYEKVIEALLKKESIDVNSRVQGNKRVTPLHMAVKNRHYKAVKVLLKAEKIDINIKTEDGFTPLHLAAQNGYKEVVEVLLKNSADINAKTIEGATSLHYAAQNDHKDVVDALLNEGALVDVRTTDQNSTPLHLAAQNGYKEVVEALLKKSADINAKTIEDSTPLHYAAQEGHKDVVQTLLTSGAQVNAKTYEGFTPLHLAALSGNKDVIQALLIKGADCESVDRFGRTPLDIAELRGMSEVIELLQKKVKPKKGIVPKAVLTIFDAIDQNNIKKAESLLEEYSDNIRYPNDDDNRPLHYAILQRNLLDSEKLDFVRLFVRYSPSLTDYTDRYGATPLHVAAYTSDHNLVKFLIEKYPDVLDAKDYFGETPLHRVLQRSDQKAVLEIVRLLVEKGADVNIAANDGIIPLHLAVEDSDLRIVQFLIGSGSKVNAKTNSKWDRSSRKSKYEWTPLHFAVQKNRNEVIYALLDEGAEVNSKTNKGETPLHIAAQEGHKDVVQTLLYRGAEVMLRTTEGYTPLHLAAENGHKDVVEDLLKVDGIEVNAKDTDKGYTPLHSAAQNGHKNVIEALLAKGAETETKTYEGLTPLHIAAKNGHKEVIDALLNKGSLIDVRTTYLNETPLHIAAKTGHKDAVQTLLYKGAYVNAKAYEGFTPLHLAAAKGHKEVVEALLENGADVNAKGKDNWRPLHLAAQNGYKEVVQILYNNGALVDARTDRNTTPLHVAAEEGHEKVVKLLLDKGADVNAEKTDAVTPLHSAAEKGRGKVIKLLIEKKANVNAKTTEGITPLHYAAQEGHKEVVQILLNKGADVNTQDNTGWTPLHFATKSHIIDVIKLLIEKKANVNAKTTDISSCTPLDIAVHFGNKDVVEILLKNGANFNVNPKDMIRPAFFPLHLNDSIKKVLELTGKLFTTIRNDNLSEDEKVNNLEVDIREGGVVSATDNEGNTVLHVSIMKGLNEASKFLLSRAKEHLSSSEFIRFINARNREELTPLHFAAKNGHKEVVEALLNGGAEVNAKEQKGNWTPLHYAARNGHRDVVEALLNKGAEVNAKTKDNLTPLHLAAHAGKLYVVEHLIDKGANIDAKDNDGYTPLHCAAAGGALNVATYLIEKKHINLNLEGTITGRGLGDTPLHLAALFSNLNVVKYLIGQGANINAINKDGYTPLHRAAEGGALNVVKYLIEEQHIDLNLKTDIGLGYTPLHWAAQEGKLNVVEYLVGKDANVDAKDKDNWTPLHYAAQNGHKEVVETLIEHVKEVKPNKLNEFVNTSTKEGATPLHLAAEKGHKGVVEALLKVNGVKVNARSTDKGGTPLHSAAHNGNKEVVELLLGKKADVNAKTKDGATPLHLAVDNGHNEVVQTLLSNGANVNAEEDFTPLELARAAQNLPKNLDKKEVYIQIIKILESTQELFTIINDDELNKEHKIKQLKNSIENGGIVGATDNEKGYTLLHYAVQKNYGQIVDLLLKKGADPTRVTVKGKTPLHLAAFKGYETIVNILLRNVEQENSSRFNDFINAKDSAGMSPLHWAIHEKYENIVKILLDSGSDVFQVTSNREDNKRNTSLHIASSKGHKELVKFLLKHIQEKHSYRLVDFINAGTNEKNTALHISVKKGNFEIVKLLLDYGADPNAKNSQDQTPLHLAIEEGYEEIVQALLDNRKTQVNSDHMQLVETKLNSSTEQPSKREVYKRIKGILECSLGQSSGRSRREIGKCELSWNTDIERIREGEENVRSLSNLKINSDKFIDYIKSISENKRTQLIQLAEQVPIIGQSQGLVNKIISNQKFINHLSKVGMISGMTMQGMMAKNVLADAVNGNYQGLAINLGFIALPFGVKAGENAALKGLHSASEIAYARGFKLAPLVESSLARSFKLSSSFLARSTSAFIAYDLYRSVKELRNGTEEALVGVVGDSVYLGVDAAELGIEVAEGFGVLEGVSSVTGPIGATIGAVVFVGTDVYQAVKKVENIDRLVHLTEEERLLEGIRAFIGIGTERQIEELIEEKQLYNQLVKQALEYLKQHKDIQRYVFPTGKLVQDTCNMVQYKEQCPYADLVGDLMAVQNEPTSSDIRSACNIDKNGNRFILKEREECTTKFQPDSDNTVILDEQKPDIKWSKIRPDNPSEGNLFCIPQGHGQLAAGLAYSCNNAIGVEYVNNRTNNYTLLDLGDGTDYARGFKDSNNIFFIGNGNKTISGGEKDDTFILQGNRFEGKISGGNGTNTLDLSKFSPQSKSLFLSFRGNNLPTLGGLIDQISKVITRENKEDIISCKDVTLKYIDGRGGRNENEQDVITIEFDYCQRLLGTAIECRDYLSGRFTPKVQIMLRDYTTVNNYASKGNFSYFVDQKEGKASVNILSTSKNEFIFNNTLENIKSINFNSSDVRTVKFTFSPHNTETLISYRVQNISFILKDGTVISVSKEGNLYALQNSNKSVDEIINSYAAIANNLKMSIFVHSLLNNESIVVGHGKHDVIENNPEYKSHLVGNGGENIFVVTSDKLPIPEIVLYDVDQENKIDTLDLRKIRKQVESDLNVKVKTRIVTSGKDLIIQLFYEKDNEVSESNIVQVRLKNGLLTNWYDRLHVIMNHVPMKIEEFELKPLPLVFDNNEEIIRIAAEDVDKNNKIIISQKIEDYTFSKLGNDLIMTFNHNASLILSDFDKNKEMETLTIRFANKEVAIKDELSNVKSFDDLKEEYRNNTTNIINNFNTTEARAGFSTTEATEASVKPFRRNRRDIEGNVKSAASRSTSFINNLIGWVKNSIGKWFEAQQSYPQDDEAKPVIQNQFYNQDNFNYSMPTVDNQGENRNVALPEINSEIVNSTVMLANFAIRLYTKEKQGYTVGLLSKDKIMKERIDTIHSTVEKAITKGNILYGDGEPNTNLSSVSTESAVGYKGRG